MKENYSGDFGGETEEGINTSDSEREPTVKGPSIYSPDSGIEERGRLIQKEKEMDQEAFELKTKQLRMMIFDLVDRVSMGQNILEKEGKKLTQLIEETAKRLGREGMGITWGVFWDKISPIIKRDIGRMTSERKKALVQIEKFFRNVSKEEDNEVVEEPEKRNSIETHNRKLTVVAASMVNKWILHKGEGFANMINDDIALLHRDGLLNSTTDRLKTRNALLTEIAKILKRAMREPTLPEQKAKESSQLLSEQEARSYFGGITQALEKRL